MLKRTRGGLIAWGIITFFIGIMFMYIYITDFMTAQNRSGLIVGGIILAVGLAILVSGIINAIKVSAINKQIIENDAGFSYVTNCIHCGRPVRCKIQDFHTHGRFPEGFSYCPICKHPISFNAFTKVPDNLSQH